MSFEIEVKFRDVDHAHLEASLLAMGAVPASHEEHEDHYLNHPSRDFAVSNEAFRIRRIGEENRITYKGPKREGPTKTREEIEIGFTEGAETFAQLDLMLNHLGFRPVATVRKHRHSFQILQDNTPIVVTLDRVDGLGEFAEIEIVVEKDSEISEAQGAILRLAEKLGLTDRLEPRSYLRLLLEQRQAI